jgi:hypothetical protein
MIFLRCLEVGYRGPPIKRLFGMSGTESTHQTPNLGQIWSTREGPKWPKSVPDLNRNFQGSLWSAWLARAEKVGDRIEARLGSVFVLSPRSTFYSFPSFFRYRRSPIPFTYHGQQRRSLLF